MTLAEFFDWTGAHPGLVVGYFIAIPLIALIANVFSRGEGHLSPWRYLFAILIYLVAIPGIFAVTLSIYLFLFERQSIMETNLFTQVLPVLSMLGTFLLVRRQVNLRHIPGMDRLSSLSGMLMLLMLLMWIIDKTHIIAITRLPFLVVMLALVAGFLLIRFGWKRLVRQAVRE